MTAMGFGRMRLNNIYLAMIDSKKVIRIGTDGNPETVLDTEFIVDYLQWCIRRQWKYVGA